MLGNECSVIVLPSTRWASGRPTRLVFIRGDVSSPSLLPGRDLPLSFFLGINQLPLFLDPLLKAEGGEIPIPREQSAGTDELLCGHGAGQLSFRDAGW